MTTLVPGGGDVKKADWPLVVGNDSRVGIC